MEEEKHIFYSKGTRCSGTLYLPSRTSSPPVVIMAHGFGAEKTFLLPEIAKRFVEDGNLAVFLFDYRNFGESDGEPRNLISPWRHVEDWKAALEYVRTIHQINGKKVGLWGTSFSGGHVLETAARDEGVSALVAQVPFVDALSTLSMFSLTFSLKGIYHGLRDLLKSIFTGNPHRVPIVGTPDKFALLNTPDTYPGYMALVPENTSWENLCPARITLFLSFYRPRRKAGKINCPVLLMPAEKDNLIPVQVAKKTGEKIKNAHVIPMDAGHFDLYFGELFEKTISIQTDFFQEHLDR